jgi:hypothetical protein
VAANILETTRQAELQPLMAPSGIEVHQNFAQLRAELKKSFSEEYVGLFAQPNADPATGDIQWYAPIGGTATRLTELDAKTRASVEAKLAPLIKDIAAHAERLQKSDNAVSRLMGGNLVQALEIPDESHIFAIGDQPVLAAWGHVPRGPATPIRLLVTLAQHALAAAPAAGVDDGQQPSHDGVPPPPPTQAAPFARAEPAARAQVQQAEAGDGGPSRYRLLVSPNTFGSVPVVASNWAWLSALLWLLFTLLLLLIGYLLLKYCAIGLPGGADSIRNAIFNFCDAPVVSESGPPIVDNSHQPALLARLHQLEVSIADKQRACHAQIRPEQPASTQEATRRLHDAEGRIGVVNVILTWNTNDDLDLHAKCPDGTHIFYSNPRACGAVLDIDQNMSDNNVTATPVENIFWADATGAAPGEYTVYVDRYKTRSSGSAPTKFRVELRINNVPVEAYDGTIDGERNARQIFTFKLPYERPH